MGFLPTGPEFIQYGGDHRILSFNETLENNNFASFEKLAHVNRG
jgi:hypothetical protein